MGLDMYLEGRTYNWTDWKNPENNPTRDGFKIKGITLELGYWRKHPDLHGFIVQTFANGIDECQEIYLTVGDLHKILEATEADALPHTEGFFFGQSQPEDKAHTIETIKAAIKWIEAGDKPPRYEPESIGAGMAAVMVKPEDIRDIRETREVVYRASW